MRPGPGLAALVVAVALAACSALPGTHDGTSPPDDGAGTVSAGPADRYLQQQRARAEQAQAQGRWADAALAWEVLSLLRPADGQARQQLGAVRQHIEQLRARHAAAARAAQQRGQLDTAQRAWLQVLALEPRDEAAAAALRQIEQERSGRAQLGRFSRATSPTADHPPRRTPPPKLISR